MIQLDLYSFEFHDEFLWKKKSLLLKHTRLIFTVSENVYSQIRSLNIGSVISGYFTPLGSLHTSCVVPARAVGQ